MASAAAASASVPFTNEYMAAELLRRRRARVSLLEYARAIEIPGMPQREAANDEEWLTADLTFTPVESAIAKHHRVMMQAIQTCMETANGRLMIMAPPGSAKSTYAAVVGVSWAMGKWPGSRYIIATYATKLARKQSRKALQVTRQGAYRSIWPENPAPLRTSAEEWSLDNGSELMAAGILAGITGNRANGIVCDDLIAGREEAESVTIREKTMEEFRDSVESRLLKDGWIILINTRWHQQDPCGQLLPEDYKGQSGPVKCQDGQVWYVLNIPARAEYDDDPIGRPIGVYLWGEYLPAAHWQRFENNPLGRRRWASLYQQRPTAEAGDDFKREDAVPYVWPDYPEGLRLYGASDYAVKELDVEQQKLNKVDRAEHGLVGMDEIGDLWFLGWETTQGVSTDKSIAAFTKLARKAKAFNRMGVARWWDEGGTIDKAIRPALRRAMRESKVFVQVEALPSIADKRAKCQSFAARYGARTCHFPTDENGNWLPWVSDVLDQLCGFPGHRYDDKYDVCGLIGRGIDVMHEGEPEEPEEEAIKPYTERWLESTDDEDKPKVRYK